MGEKCHRQYHQFVMQWLIFFPQEMEKLRLDNEEGKKATLDELAKMEDAMKQRDREMEKLDYAVECKRKTGQSQDEEVG